MASMYPTTLPPVSQGVRDARYTNYQSPVPGAPQATGPTAPLRSQQAGVGQSQGGVLQDPGNNLTNAGYGEQALQSTQTRLQSDPSAAFLQNAAYSTQNPTSGEQWLNQNLGTLNGPGAGEQYWNQQQGQFMSPFAGEQFARSAAQNMAPTGAAGAFNTMAQGQAGQFMNYQGAGNTQGQYGQSAASLAGGTQGEQGLGQLAGQYGAIGQYNGQNNALGQYQQNASSGPLAAQQFYDQVQGQYGQIGQYNDPNLAAGQYAQTQQAFGDMPIANFDPFYDRARQLATQDYNRQSAGRGVYGSSEALSGVGNVITDIEAQRANRSFDAEMQRTQEQRARQQLLGEQARQGDLSSLSAFGANLAGVETFGNLANQAGNQTLGQQTMLGNQARQSDVSATDAFNANLAGANTFANINNMQANQELGRNELLGSMANAADTQATSAANTRVSGLNALGNIASNADTAETNRFTARTNAMEAADRTQLERQRLGADTAFRTDDSRRADFTAQSGAAASAAQTGLNRTVAGANIANQASGNDLNRLNSFNQMAQGAEGQRQERLNSAIEATQRQTDQVQRLISDNMARLQEGDFKTFDDYWNATVGASLNSFNMSKAQQEQMRTDLRAVYDAAKDVADKADSKKK